MRLNINRYDYRAGWHTLGVLGIGIGTSLLVNGVTYGWPLTVLGTGIVVLAHRQTLHERGMTDNDIQRIAEHIAQDAERLYNSAYQSGNIHRVAEDAEQDDSPSNDHGFQ